MRDIEAERKTLLIVDHQVAVAGLRSSFRRCDLNIGLCCCRAFEIFQPLFDIAQIEDIALADRQGIPGCAARAGIGSKTDMANVSGQDGQGQLNWKRSAASPIRLMREMEKQGDSSTGKSVETSAFLGEGKRTLGVCSCC